MNTSDNKNVMLRIVGAQIVDGKADPDSKIEFVTEGTYREQGDTRYLSYPESELSGLEGCTTYLTIEPTRIYMSRKGEELQEDTLMEFETGKRFEDTYHTPFGDVGMELLTNAIETSEKKVHIDYNISLAGMGDARNQLDIEIL